MDNPNGATGCRGSASTDTEFGYDSDSLIDGVRRGRGEVHQGSSTRTPHSRARRFSVRHVEAGCDETQNPDPSLASIKDAASELKKDVKKVQVTQELPKCSLETGSPPVLHKFALYAEIPRSEKSSYGNLARENLLLEQQVQDAKLENKALENEFQQQLQSLTKELILSKIKAANLQVDLIRYKLKSKAEEVRLLEEAIMYFRKAVSSADRYAMRLVKIDKWFRNYPSGSFDENVGVKSSSLGFKNAGNVRRAASAEPDTRNWRALFAAEKKQQKGQHVAYYIRNDLQNPATKSDGYNSA